jgi:SRSO17 transposase
MCSESAAFLCSDPGASGDQSLALPTSPRRDVRPTGNACRQGDGTKGPRLLEWCYLELADLDAEQFNTANDDLWTRGLLIRRRIADNGLAFFTTWCPAGTATETLVAVEGHRWAIEDSFETAKNEFGLDHNESRSWHGWHHHVSMVMFP